MAIPTATTAQLATEGIETVKDLAEFSKDDIDQLAKNLRATVDRNGFSFACFWCQVSQTVANLVQLNIQWYPVMKKFCSTVEGLERSMQRCQNTKNNQVSTIYEVESRCIHRLSQSMHWSATYTIVQCQQSNNSSTLSHWVSAFHTK